MTARKGAVAQTPRHDYDFGGGVIGHTFGPFPHAFTDELVVCWAAAARSGAGRCISGLCDTETAAVAALEAAAAELVRVGPVDPCMQATLFFCSECDRASSSEAWQSTWWTERARRRAHPDYTEGDHGSDLGLDDRMVCPRCRYVHADDECSYVKELTGEVFAVEPRPADRAPAPTQTTTSRAALVRHA